MKEHETGMPRDGTPGDQACEVRPGDLDGMTILRYTQSYRERSSASIELHLRCLNQGLLQRHRMTILQTHLVKDFSGFRVEVEKLGKGRIVWIPIACWQSKTRFAGMPARALYAYRQTFTMRCQNGEGTVSASGKAIKAVSLHGFGRLRHRLVVLTDHLSDFLASFKVNLLAVHWVTYDTEVLVRHAEGASIPFILIHHFDNGMYSEPPMRGLTSRAIGLGGISSHHLPDHLLNRFINLSNPIDTDFFSTERARYAISITPPMILMPALIKRSKGHLDLFRAACILRARNIDFQICCSGAVEDESLLTELRKYVAANGLEQRVSFLGEIPQEQLRQYYAFCSLVALPTYLEGLGRVLVEAQAMKKPVVAYDSGGVSDTFLPNETGFLVEKGDVETLADRIGFLLTNESERVRFGERGRQFVVPRFNAAAIVRRHESFYLRAISGRDTDRLSKKVKLSGSNSFAFSNLSEG